MEQQMDVGSLSFYWRMVNPTAAPEASDLPEFLPFGFAYDRELRLVRQIRNDQVEAALRQTYLMNHNIGYMQLGHALAERYGQDFLRFFDQVNTRAPAPIRSILDIGCGGCYLLHEFQKRGLEVYGVDPSPTAARQGAALGIPITVGFYPVEHPYGQMDAVVSSGVLEHVPNPVEFLWAQHRELQDDGLLLLATPDSEPSIALGDLSMVLHQHLSYFDEESLRCVLAAAGFEIVLLSRAHYGASLYCAARKAKRPPDGTVVPTVYHGPDTKFARFKARCKAGLARMEAYLRPLLANSSAEVGFYVPLRALPYLSRLGIFTGFRFFDDDPGVHGQYFDGFRTVPVENYDDLQRRPVTHMIIMSLPHAPVIGRKLRQRFGAAMAVTTLETILTSESTAALPT